MRSIYIRIIKCCLNKKNQQIHSFGSQFKLERVGQCLRKYEFIRWFGDFLAALFLCLPNCTEFVVDRWWRSRASAARRSWSPPATARSTWWRCSSPSSGPTSRSKATSTSTATSSRAPARCGAPPAPDTSRSSPGLRFFFLTVTFTKFDFVVPICTFRLIFDGFYWGPFLALAMRWEVECFSFTFFEFRFLKVTSFFYCDLISWAMGLNKSH